MTDATGAVVRDAAYRPFGEEAAISGAETNNQRFPGQYFDQETGLHYNYFRDYDPGIGRYVQSDPIGLQGGLNTYAYVGGNPLVYGNPYGLTHSWPEQWKRCRELCAAQGKMVRTPVILFSLAGVELSNCECEKNCPVDSYENPGTHDPKGGGPNKFDPTKETLPKNHEELWKQSRPDADNPDKTRWAKEGAGKKARYHRFQSDNAGKWHWNGSSRGGTTASGQPRSIPANKVPKW